MQSDDTAWCLDWSTVAPYVCVHKYDSWNCSQCSWAAKAHQIHWSFIQASLSYGTWLKAATFQDQCGTHSNVAKRMTLCQLRRMDNCNKEAIRLHLYNLYNTFSSLIFCSLWIKKYIIIYRNMVEHSNKNNDPRDKNSLYPTVIPVYYNFIFYFNWIWLLWVINEINIR